MLHSTHRHRFFGQLWVCRITRIRNLNGAKEIYYSTFTEEPKHFDPAISYSSDEYRFIQQIYEPPLRYHYLKRPYTLVPLTAAAIPQPRYYDARRRELPSDAPAASVARAVYEIRIRPGIMYQPHPCFARTKSGALRYHDLEAADVSGFAEIKDFPMTGGARTYCR